MTLNIVNQLKKIIPPGVWYFFKKIYYLPRKSYYYIYYNLFHLRYKNLVKQIRKKDKIKVAFFLIHESIWKYEKVYRLMESDERFDPLVVICPYVSYGEEHMHQTMDQAYKSFLSKSYNVIRTFNEVTKEWLDVKKDVKPDIVFFTNPHGGVTMKEYYINSYLDYLTCYVPYAIMVPSTYEGQFNQVFHNVIWKSFYETTIHKRIAKKYAYNKGRNVTVTGYPGCDVFLNKEYKPKDCWKIKDESIKRIIWAPHHFMKEERKTSNFLEYHQIMIDIAKKYSRKIQIAFKPHPIIKPKLYSYPEWGKERTDKYFKEWELLDNGQLEEGDYVDLFLTSDALILDCGSFISEYIFTGKPALFMISNDEVMKGFNEYGEKAINVLYQSRKIEDVHSFIDKVVLEEKDPMKNLRTKFLEEILMPPNNMSASENIYYSILNELQ